MERNQNESHGGIDDLARRILRIEERLDRLEEGKQSDAIAHSAWPMATGSAAMVFGYLGMGVPLHPYQYLFPVLLLALAYHRGFLRFAGGPWRWPLVVTNFLNLSLCFIIILGGGVRHPLFWFKTPGVVKQPSQEGASWYGKMVPDYSVQWNEVPGLSDWTLDLTRIQAFLLIATLAGVLFRFPGFSSIMATALLIVSIPAYLSFSWDWVMLFLVLACLAFYLQSQPARPRWQLSGEGPGTKRE